MIGKQIEHPFNDKESIVNYLKRSRLLNPLPESLLQKIAPLFKVMHVPENTEIIRGSKMDANIFFLIRGQIAIYSNGNLIFKLKRIGDMCGEMSFITNKPCTASEVADTPVDLFCLNISDIYEKTDYNTIEIKAILYQLFSAMLADKLTLTCDSMVSQSEFTISRLNKSNDLIKKAQYEAENARRIRDEFLANISHEIRTPMHGVLGMTSLLLDTELNDQQKEFARIIEKSSQSFMNVINDILDFSKLKTGEVELHYATFDIFRLVDEVIADLSENADRKGLKLKAKIDPNIPNLLQGDSLRIHQILINLTGNALKFTEKGEVVITVDLLNETDAAIRLFFSVIDTGIGIHKDNMHRLFKSFSQIDPSLTRKFGGTGLGLVISKQLVKIMGGEIGVSSEEGKGSNFWFKLMLKKQKERRTIQTTELPLHRKLSRFNDKQQEFGPHKGKHIKVLLVEDDNISQLVAKLTLKKLGYSVVIASNGKEAIKILCEKIFDIILMDIQMPEMDGIETTRFIRSVESAPQNRNIPIIAMTAHLLDSDRGKCLNAGMNDYITKPISEEELSSVMQRWITTQVSNKNDQTTSNQQDNASSINVGMLERLRKNVGDINPLVQLFLEELPDKIEKISIAVSEQNPDILKKTAHTLKSNCITFGALTMADICMEMELIGNSGETDGTDELMRQLVRESKKVVAFLKNNI